MTTRDRMYLAACQMPPTPAREVIFDCIVLAERQAARPKTELHRDAVRYYRQLLRCVEGGQLPAEYVDRSADWLAAEMARKAVAATKAA